MLYLDTETTGLTFYDTVVEVAIVDDDGAVLMHTLCNPGFAMSDEVIQIHGITNEMVADAPSSADVIQQVLDICRGQAVCIFNSEFDSRMIAGLRDVVASTFCCMQKFATFYGDWSDYHCSYRWKSLSFAAKYTKFIWPSDSHRALADALACRHVWQTIPKLEAAEEIKRQAEVARREELEVSWCVAKSCSDYVSPTGKQHCQNADFEFWLRNVKSEKKDDATFAFTIKQRERAESTKKKREAKRAAKHAEKLASMYSKTEFPFFSNRDWPKKLCMHVSQIMNKYGFDPRYIVPQLKPVACAETNAIYHVVSDIWLISEVEERNATLTEAEKVASRTRKPIVAEKFEDAEIAKNKVCEDDEFADFDFEA